MRWLALIVMTACAAEEERDKPEAPDMSELIAAYAAPTANFDLDGATELQPFVEEKVRALIDFDAIVDRLQETIAALNEEPSFAPTRAIVLEGEGTARVERICTGFGDPEPPVDKDANGFIELTAGYSNDGLDPVVFGGATACQEQVAGARLQVSGDVNLFVGVGTGITELAQTTFLFQ